MISSVLGSHGRSSAETLVAVPSGAAGAPSSRTERAWQPVSSRSTQHPGAMDLGPSNGGSEAPEGQSYTLLRHPSGSLVRIVDRRGRLAGPGLHRQWRRRRRLRRRHPAGCTPPPPPPAAGLLDWHGARLGQGEPSLCRLPVQTLCRPGRTCNAVAAYRRNRRRVLPPACTPPAGGPGGGGAGAACVAGHSGAGAGPGAGAQAAGAGAGGAGLGCAHCCPGRWGPMRLGCSWR